jgi:hypothetical protein
MSFSEEFSCENAIIALREKGYTATESTFEVTKNGTNHVINSFTITRPRYCTVKIYDRSQYATDFPRVGLYVEPSGMYYGDRSCTLRVSCLNDILKHIE